MIQIKFCAILILLLSGFDNSSCGVTIFQAEHCFSFQHRFSVNIHAQPDTTNIYFTIDDGPSAASFYLSNFALSHEIPVTAFIIGDSIVKNNSSRIFYELYLSNPFIEIGNHSFSHAGKHYHHYYENPPGVVRDFQVNKDTLQLQTMIARLPGRNTWRVNRKARTDLSDASISADTLATLGYRIFGWDIEWHCATDAQSKIDSATVLISKIEHMARNKDSFIPGNIVILSHESMFTNAESQTQLELFFKLIKKKKTFRLCFLRNYPDVISSTDMTSVIAGQ